FASPYDLRSTVKDLGSKDRSACCISPNDKLSCVATRRSPCSSSLQGECRVGASAAATCYAAPSLHVPHCVSISRRSLTWIRAPSIKFAIVFVSETRHLLCP